MDAELKAKWVQALRSGEYQQCNGLLRFERDDGKSGYCCLGVLLDVQGAAWTQCENRSFDASLGGSVFASASDADKFVDALPLKLLTETQALELMNMNDGAGVSKQCTFTEIADYIEREL